MISISIVSHGHAEFVQSLLDDLKQKCTTPIEVLITLNIPEKSAIDASKYAFPISVVSNATPRGFGANHNAAFKRARGAYFCVMNPDIRLADDPFPALLDCARTNRVGVVAPRVVNPVGTVEDSARPFPTPARLLWKALGTKKAEYADITRVTEPDWVAGMFMLFPAAVYQDVGGFDESYFLYYEDIDLGTRLRCRGYRTILCHGAVVTHDARRTSRRNVRYLRWHLASIVRYFVSRPYRQVRRLSR